MRIEVSFLTCVLAIFSVGSSDGTMQGENPDSLERAFRQALSKFSPPKLLAREKLVRGYQQRGYASTLLDVLGNDGVNAIVSYAKVRLQIELSLPHEPIMVNISALPNHDEMVGLDIDWTFPSDPWSKK